MSTVLNRTTKAYITSANTVEYPVQDWIIEPDMSAVVGLPSKYWVITGDVVSAMPQAERDALDAAELQAQRDATSARLDLIEDIARAGTLVQLDELNSHATKINAILTAIDNGSNAAEIKVNIAAIADHPQRTIAQYKNAVRNKLGT